MAASLSAERVFRPVEGKAVEGRRHPSVERVGGDPQQEHGPDGDRGRLTAEGACAKADAEVVQRVGTEAVEAISGRERQRDMAKLDDGSRVIYAEHVNRRRAFPRERDAHDRGAITTQPRTA